MTRINIGVTINPPIRVACCGLSYDIALFTRDTLRGECCIEMARPILVDKTHPMLKRKVSTAVLTDNLA